MTLPIGELVGVLALKGAGEFDAGILGAQRSMNLAGESATKLGAATDEASVGLAASSRSANLASASSAKLRAAQLSAIAANERYNAVLTDTNASTARLASTEASLIRANQRVAATQAEIAAASAKASAATVESSTAMTGIAGRMGGLLATAGKLGFAFGGIALAIQAIDKIKAGAQFQKQMLQIQTLTGGTAAEVRNMSKAILDMGASVATAPDQLATSLYHVESVGLRGAQAMNVVDIAAKGAKVGMADLEETTNALTSTVASGIPGVQNMSQAMGALLTIVGAGDMKMSDLNEALGGGILAVVKGYGLSLRDVGAALATFGDNNIRGADAATALRMAVQSLAVPAAKGKDAIESIGLSMTTLQKDMQTGGLNKALLDLNRHMKEAGITGVQVGGYLTEAFGKRAGIGLSVLMGQLDRFESKVAAIRDGSASFQSKWQATTQTVSFAFQRLGAMVEAAGVQAFEKVGPAAATAANWLGTTLPHAISELQSILAPLERNIGTVLVVGFHGLADVLKVAGGAFSLIASAVEAVKGPLTTVATVVLTTWAAFKGYTIATAALAAVRLAMMRMASTAPYALAAVGRSASTLAAGLSPAMAGLAGMSLIIGAAILHSRDHAAALAAERQQVSQLTDAISVDSGAIGEHTRATVKDSLESSGAFAAANKLGVSLETLTDASLGNTKALAQVYLQAGSTAAQMKMFSRLVGDSDGQLQRSSNTDDRKVVALATLYDALNLNNSAVRAAVQAAKDKASADGKSVAGIGALSTAVQPLTQYQKDLAQASKDTTLQLDGTTYAMNSQSTASDILTAALARLSGDSNAVAESQLALKDSLAGIIDQIKQQAKQYKDSGTSLSANTVEGRKNLEWLHQQIDAINSVASAQIKNGTSTQHVSDTLGKNEKALRAAAIAAGLNAGAVDKLIKKYAATPKKLETYVVAHTDQAAQKALTLAGKLDALTKQRTALLKLNDETRGQAGISSLLDTIQQKINKLTSTPYTTSVNVNDQASGALDSIISKMRIINRGGSVEVHTVGGKVVARAAGGPITGSGPKGIDSVPLIGAPGEWMMRASAVDKYGAAFMQAVNAGTFPVGAAPASGGGVTHVHHHRHVHVGDMPLTFNYPDREKDTTALPRAARIANEQIGSFL